MASITPNRKVIDMLDKSKRTIATLTAAACLGAGGWAVAANSSGASTAATQTTQAPSTTIQQQAPAQGQYGAPPAGQQGQRGPQGIGPGGHGTGETLLTGDNAAKAKAAALAKIPGATIDRVETDANDGATYEAHITKSDGSHATVLMDKSFTVTSVLPR